ncbi:unnamed protein product [Hyaloperonospora brassicae]|uniref:BHLH domain-containing protein n=1 Tax=Hyaloperonospora brassicae TaxID=162125 RepID=A0AAV0UDJ4_HYABA|nr:unnamed protein product [Hyaloperonospora brassicae]
MEFDEDMSGLQIEDLGEYFLQTDAGDNWKGFSLGYTDDASQSRVERSSATLMYGSDRLAAALAPTAGDTSMQYMASPALSNFSDALKYGDRIGVGLGFGAPTKELATSFRTGWTPESAKADVAMMCPTAREEMELANFSLDHDETPTACGVSDTMAPHAVAPRGEHVKSAAFSLQQSARYQNVLISDDDDDDAKGCRRAVTPTRVCSTIGSASSIGASSPTPDDDRGTRKKSREKMRRQEVNVKFEKLVDLLGLSNRVRKSAILQEAVSTITSLKRERDELRRDRDRLQQEVSKLATFLQYSQLGSVAAAMAQQSNQQLSRMTPSVEQLDPQQQQQQRAEAVSSGVQAARTHTPSVSCYPGATCFPLSSAFPNIVSQLGPRSSSASPVPGQVAIAPKCSKRTRSVSAYPTIAPDVNMK